MLGSEKNLDQNQSNSYYQQGMLLPEKNDLPEATQLVNYWCSEIVTILVQQREE